MAGKLKVLEQRLRGLHRRRRWQRWCTGWSLFLAALLWILLAAFLMDWLLHMSVSQRVVGLCLGAGTMVWVLWRKTLPALGRRESLTDLALRVEGYQSIDSDLVAALQFDERGALAHHGSEQLADAVVDRVRVLSDGLDVFRGFKAGLFGRNVAMLTASLAVVVGAAGIFPDHAKAFARRLFLRDGHYPTRTVIDRVFVGSQVLYNRDASAESEPSLRVPYGEIMTFRVEASGELVESGRLLVEGETSGAHLEIDLVRQHEGSIYVATSPRVLEPSRVQVHLGDAWTGWRSLAIIEQPVVQLTLVAEAPSYAGREVKRHVGTRHISVLEGSRVRLELKEVNKALRWAKMVIGEVSSALEPESGPGSGPRIWKLKSGREGTALERVIQQIAFTLDVEDRDGLSLEKAIRASIRVEPDRPPRVAAAMVTQHVMPSARPTVSYGASDDFAVKKILLHVDIVRDDGKSAANSAANSTANSAARKTFVVEDLDEPKEFLRGRYSLDLASLQLVKGDRIRLVLEAQDDRGETPGESSRSDAIMIQVTDERGVLAAMMETDQRSARQLDAIIGRQLGVGESP